MLARCLLRSLFPASAVLVSFLNCSRTDAQFSVELVATGFDFPLFVTQPNGVDDTLFVLEQRTAEPGRFATVVALDMETLERTDFLRIAGADQRFEGGGHGLAFHPDYVNNGLLYVSWIEFVPNNPDASRLDEYHFDETTGEVTHTRMLFREQSFASTFHMIDWIGFDPTATGDAMDYLYVTIGDNGRQAEESEYVNVAQDVSSPFGKVLRLDISPDTPDAYPDDPNRNYAYPLENPFADDGDDATLGEILHTGLRNPWRASFDRETGDLYIGNVGHEEHEEIELALAGESGIDFGWARREGTVATPVSAVAGPQGDSRNPLFEMDQPPARSFTGGYVYRGPVQELNGTYIFADALIDTIWFGEPDLSVDPQQFDGTHMQNLLQLDGYLESLLSANEGEELTIDNVVSFGEDNEGNVYIIEFGNGIRPEGGTGTVYKIVPSVRIGDYDQSGFVGQEDLDLVLLNWGQSAHPTPDGWVNDLPFGTIDQHELDGVLLNWGADVNGVAAALPEPATLVAALLMTIASAIGYRWQHRCR